MTVIQPPLRHGDAEIAGVDTVGVDNGGVDFTELGRPDHLLYCIVAAKKTTQAHVNEELVNM